MVSPEALHRMTAVAPAAAQAPAMFIMVKIGQQYGQRTIHPADHTANLFCELAGLKTLTPRTVELIKKLGYEVRVVQDLPESL